MIVRPHSHWISLLFVWRGSVLHRILPRLMVVAAVSVLAVLARGWWFNEHANSSLSIPPFTLMGIALAIFLGFRNSVSYERYWEARKLWGGLLVAARSVMRQLHAAAPDHPATARLGRGLAACTYALLGQMRHTDQQAQLARLLPAQLLPRVSEARFKPAFILHWLGSECATLLREGTLSELQYQSIDENLNRLSEMIGGCERIASTPIPFSYRVLLNRTVTLYCLLLPIGLATSTGWLTPLIAAFIAYTYMALDVIGDELEDPFGMEPNDLPLASLSHTIESAIMDVLGEPLTEPAPQAHNYIMH
ncbi:putative membrane protein [Silvimonas terrae]|uniref:Putative membrane protein n=1 Tax=Silvimonas terrae TaxID=300266 RepID=A0A840RM47_9NEIS|nr:bestrophin family ion channel [Silvimonas terrae]MBB5193346.1 putative membrane protein [Silvimonas terrae]